MPHTSLDPIAQSVRAYRRLVAVFDLKLRMVLAWGVTATDTNPVPVVGVLWPIP